MRTRRNPGHQPETSDIGTLWTMVRGDHAARCALITGRRLWRVCVLIDGDLLLQDRCTRMEEAFALADEWKRRMLSQGWEQVLPGRRLSSVFGNVTA